MYSLLLTILYYRGTTLAEDSLHCLRAMSCSPGGVQYLIKHHSLEALTRAYIMQNEG